MKGISLPMNAIIIVAIAALVLVAFGAFFITNTGGTMSDADAQRVFAGGCVQYCKPDLYQTFLSAYDAAQNDYNFIIACKKLGYGDSQHVNSCLERCSNCNLNVTRSDIHRPLDNANILSTR